MNYISVKLLKRISAFFSNVYFWDRDRVWTGKGQRERERERESSAGSRLWAVSTEPDTGLEPTNHEIIYFWESEKAWAGEGQREGETQNPKEAPGSELSAQSLTPGSSPRIARSWPEPKLGTWQTEPPRRPWTWWVLSRGEKGASGLLRDSSGMLCKEYWAQNQEASILFGMLWLCSLVTWPCHLNSKLTSFLVKRGQLD